MLFSRQLKALSLALRRIRLPRGIAAGKGASIRKPFSIPDGRGISLGSNTKIHLGATILTIRSDGGRTYDPRIAIGNDVYVGRYIFLNAIDKVTIGDGCVLSDYVYINDAAHGLNPAAGPIMEQPLESKGPICIGNKCFLGYRVAVMPGVTLGEGCVVGINAVVTRSFPPYSMLAGVPARIVRAFDHATQTWIPISSPNEKP
jgi:acetyltransferase-like isoleucine patch superfamily enzyme